MTKRLLAGLVLLLAARAATAQQAPPRYSWREARLHVGENAIVEGTIVATRNTGSVCYLNFHRDYQTHVSVVIFSENFDRFVEPPERAFKNKLVRVTGTIGEYRGRPQIIITGPEKIEIVSPTAPAARAAPSAGNSSSAPRDPRILSWRDAPKHMGEDVVVEGRIVLARNIGKYCFLNFDPDYRRHLTAIVGSADFHKFRGPIERMYLGKRVRVSGKITRFEERPRIVVESPDQIEVLPSDDAEARSAGESESFIPWRGAADFAGLWVVVEGTIVRSRATSGATFLNFDPDYRRTLGLVIFENRRHLFPVSAAEHYRGRRVRATGLVRIYRGRPEIILEAPSQIAVLDSEPPTERR